MHVAHILNDHTPSVSFEFFPPKTDQAANNLFETIQQLSPLGPSFVSVTYGAGGTTRERTRDLVMRLNSEAKVTAVPHLTTVGATREEIRDILETYVERGVENVLALRGDPPGDAKTFEPTPGGFGYANELVEFIKDEFPKLGIGVAAYPEGHPENRDRLTDLKNLRRKVDAGADVIITQLFFENRDFYDFRERCSIVGIETPIIAGIMPIQSIKGVQRMAALSGARIPAPLLRALYRAQDDPEAVRNVGAHWASEQCRDLIDQKVAGIHFYTLNKSNATRRIYESLGIKTSEALRTTSTSPTLDA